jgi:hypothetical protein
MHSPLSVLSPANVPVRLSVSVKVKNVTPSAVRLPVTVKLVCVTEPLAETGGAALAADGAPKTNIGAKTARTAIRRDFI